MLRRGSGQGSGQIRPEIQMMMKICPGNFRQIGKLAATKPAKTIQIGHVKIRMRKQHTSVRKLFRLD